jgi:tRNA(Arg) A34 adenosine deaminase TadA
MPETLHTDDIIEEHKPLSGDPCKQVVAIGFLGATVLAVGVNEIIDNRVMNIPNYKEILNDPTHPAKKLLMRHAEISLIDGINSLPDLKLGLYVGWGVYCSLQPCLDCVKALATAGAEYVYWKEPNRHQHEQELMAPYVKHLFKEYAHKPEGLTMNAYRF